MRRSSSGPGNGFDVELLMQKQLLISFVERQAFYQDADEVQHGQDPEFDPELIGGFLSHLAWESRIPQEEQESPAAERDIWNILISLLLH